MNTIRIAAAATLIEALLGTGLSRTKIKQLVKYRAIRVDGVAATRPDQPVQAGMVVTIASEKENTDPYPPCPGLPIVYEDQDIVVLDKPAGLLTIASASEKDRTVYATMRRCLAKRPGGGTIFILHRLDQGVSGLLVLAKTEAARDTLRATWSQVEQRFLALVEGRPEAMEGTVHSMLRESKAHRVYSLRPGEGGGKPAKTGYRVLRCGEESALVELVPMTSRKNQLRVHMSDLGHPVVGDKKYGAATNPLRRMALHASFIRFPHPTTGEPMTLHLDPPSGFNILAATPV
ncbi:MAG: RluA family pseudouridine synthase [Desulfobulbus sp.]|jgi:23S rRNA pseudouridine1911/1915/1917 synthase